MGAGFAVWGLAVGLIRLHDNSFLTELATGRLILDHGVPHADPYSFTAHGHPWVVQSWLASVLYGAVERAGGGHGLQLLHAGSAVILTALVWHLTRSSSALIGRLLAAGAALAVGTGYWTPRPLLIALVLLAVVVALAEGAQVPAWTAVPVMWLWVNVHGSWPLAIGYLLLRMAGRAWERRPLDHLPRLTGAVVLGTLLGAANPFGFGLLTYPLGVLTHHQAYAHILEWQSPDFTDPVNAIFLTAALLTLVLLVARKGSVEDALVTVVFVALACEASRNVPVASLVTVPALARALAGLGTLDGARRSPASLGAAVAMVGLGAIVVSSALRQPAYVLTAYPVASIDYMHANGLAPGRVATQDFVGNYLEYRFGRAASAFVDDRVDLYPQAVEADYRTLLGGGPDWQQVLDRHRVDAVLWDRHLPLAGLVAESRQWRVVRRDRGWIVATRVGAAPAR